MKWLGKILKYITILPWLSEKIIEIIKKIKSGTND